jgi:hypothetical protein
MWLTEHAEVDKSGLQTNATVRYSLHLIQVPPATNSAVPSETPGQISWSHCPFVFYKGSCQEHRDFQKLYPKFCILIHFSPENSWGLFFVWLVLGWLIFICLFYLFIYFFFGELMTLHLLGRHFWDRVSLYARLAWTKILLCASPRS